MPWLHVLLRKLRQLVLVPSLGVVRLLHSEVSFDDVAAAAAAAAAAFLLPLMYDL